LRRGDRSVCAARTGRQFVLAGLGCLQQRKTKFPIGGGGLLSLRLAAESVLHELPDGGWDEVIRWAHEDRALGRKATAVSALEVSLLQRVRGRGNARRMLDAMKQNAWIMGFHDLYAPARPTQKAHLPFLSMSEYAAMRRSSDGLPQDPWLRTHFQIGGTVVKIAPYAMTIVGTIAEWSAWTGLIFETSGAVAGALSPVHVSLEQNHAVYVEPNIWVHHRL